MRFGLTAWALASVLVLHAPLASARTACRSTLPGDFRYKACGDFCKQAKAANHCKCACPTRHKSQQLKLPFLFAARVCVLTTAVVCVCVRARRLQMQRVQLLQQQCANVAE